MSFACIFLSDFVAACILLLRDDIIEFLLPVLSSSAIIKPSLVAYEQRCALAH